jgi:RNA polymerase sigma-70 factor (ECF subfamily)
VALSDIDRSLLERCVTRQPRAWEDFVDRYMGLVVHVVNHSAQARSIRLSAQDRDDLCAEVFLALVRDDFAVLRRFRGQSSLATYLTVISRRIVVRHLIDHKAPARLQDMADVPGNGSNDNIQTLLTDRDEVERLLERLDPQEAEAIRMFHLEGKSYADIAAALGLAENSVGPTLSRAREKLRREELGANPATP